MTVGATMERFHVRRGHEKKTGGNAGLAKLAAEAFDGATADVDGRFQASFGLMVSVTGEYLDGRLVVDVTQLKGEDLQSFLEENGMEVAMESRRRWSTFLDDATGYNAKQRGDKAKEEEQEHQQRKIGDQHRQQHPQTQHIAGRRRPSSHPRPHRCTSGRVGRGQEPHGRHDQETQGSALR